MKKTIDSVSLSGLRLRRTRLNPAIRNMLAEPFPPPEKFIWPVFVIGGRGQKIPIESMPGQFRFSIDELLKALSPVAESGIGGLMLFAVPDDSLKTPDGSYAWKENGLVQKAIREIRKEFPSLLVFTDVCLCEYTSHGHCGLLKDGCTVDNDSTLELLARTAVSHAEAGAHCVAPSAMMDGQVAAIRDSLDAESYTDTLLMSYSSKFASSMYGPFREAAASAPSHGDRKSYQADYRNPRTALLESILDEGEGADILMVKPAQMYLDIIAEVKRTTLLPVAAYNVSGEYSMIHASAQKGWGNLEDMARESLCSIRRAGADIILSYWASRYRSIFPS